MATKLVKKMLKILEKRLINVSKFEKCMRDVKKDVESATSHQRVAESRYLLLVHE